VIAISYRREDSVAVAGRLYDRLESTFGRQNVFMDFDSIPVGANFREYIIAAIERSQLVIALIGPKWLGERGEGSRICDTDDFVRLEISSALARGISVIPVLVNNAEMPRPDQLPSDLRELPLLNALPLDSGRDFHIHVERLVGVIKSIHPSHGITRARRYRTLKITIALVAAFLAAALIFVLARSRSEPVQAKKPMATPTAEVSPSVATPGEVVASPPAPPSPSPSPSPASLQEFLGSWSSVMTAPITGGGNMTVLDKILVERNAIDEMIATEWTANKTIVFRIKIHIRYGELWVFGNELNARCLATDVAEVFDPKEFGKFTNISEQTANAAKAGVNLIYKFALTGVELRRGEVVFTKGNVNDRKGPVMESTPRATATARSSSPSSPSAPPSRKQRFAGKWSGPSVTTNGPKTTGTIRFEIEADDRTVRFENNRRIGANRISDTVLTWSYSQPAENFGSYIGHATLRIIGKDQASYREETTFTEGVVKGMAGPVFTGTLTKR
jgi:hypothetical protein